MQWDNPAEKSSTLTSANMGKIHSVDSSIAIETEIAALMSRIEALKTPSAL